jgi:FkbM family methyltransferase
MQLELRSIARRVRDHRVVGPAVRYPFERLKALGVRIPPRIYQHLIFRGPFTVECPGGAAFRMMSHGHVVENSVYWEGVFGHEPDSTSEWVNLARRASVVLDVGANTGLYSLLAAAVSPRASVHAFEPLPRIAELLRQNAALNPSLRIEVHAAAAGAKSGTAEIYDPGGDNCYSASLNPDFLGPSRKQACYPVPVIAIDDFMRERGLERLDLVKIDVEGFEDAVLEGMSAAIERFRPAILMEFLPSQSEALTGRVRSLVERGYGFYHLEAGRRVRTSEVRSPDRDRNVLLLA